MLRIRSAIFLLLIVQPAAALAGQKTTETIVMVRHGEKPASGLGQLSCQGLNRALKLGAVLERDFGKPAAIFAPDPAVQKLDRGSAYDYVRPLATIEPAAIAWGLPVDASIGLFDLMKLQAALEAPALADATVLVAWEHKQIVILAHGLAAAHGGAAIPDWDARDYDGIYVLRITRDGGAGHSVFSHLRENLDGLPGTCPGG